MAVVRIHRAPATEETLEDYSRVLQASGVQDNPPAGLIFHTYGNDGGQYQEIDVWESEEAADQYEQESQRFLQEGLSASYTAQQPETYELHNLIRGAQS